MSYRLTPDLDGGFTTIGQMIETARAALGDSPPSMVLATGPAFAEFVGAMALAHHWRVPFVLDYRDEWSESPFVFVHHGSSDRFWETRVIERAALVTFTTEAQREHQLKAFPGLRRERTAVVANGWDERASEAGNAEPARRASDRAIVGYLGNLGQHCDLPEFLATLRVALDGNPGLARRIGFDFIGMKPDTERRLLNAFETPGVVRDLPQVPLSAAQAAMRGCDALLLFNPPLLARYIPGKTYEYIAAGSRILLYGEGGSSSRSSRPIRPRYGCGGAMRADWPRLWSRSRRGWVRVMRIRPWSITTAGAGAPASTWTCSSGLSRTPEEAERPVDRFRDADAGRDLHFGIRRWIAGSHHHRRDPHRLLIV